MPEHKKELVLRRDFQADSGAVIAVGAPDTLRPASVSSRSETVKKKVSVAMPSRKHIVADPDICGGCRTCEAVCSLYKEGVSNPALARIQVLKDELGGYICEAMPCKQCDGPGCLQACPTGALHVDGVSGARVIDEKECIGCKSCIEACKATPPRIRFNSAKNKSIKCDLCSGEARCVKFCPTGAITYVEKDT